MAKKRRLRGLCGNIRFLFVFAALVLVADVRTSAQDWPRYGHDQSLTGRSPIRGDMDAPHVAWTYSLAGCESLVALTPASGECRLQLSADAAVEPGHPEVAHSAPLQRDLDGSGVLRPVRESFHERWAKILPDVAGWQRVAWSHTWTDQKVCRLQLFAYDEGFDRPRRVWESDPPESVVFNPLNIVFDIDGDGVQEICVAAHYRVMIFEGTTGRKETELRYHTCRPYGWFGLADVDGDGQMELVTVGDFQSHMDVLEFDPAQPEAKRLSVKWRRDIEQNIERRKKWPQVGPRPVADVTGDGRPELVLNLFDDTGDDQWHAVVLEGATGEVVCDLPRRFVQGTADVNDDGAAELFTQSTDGVLVHTSGQIELVAIEGQTPTVRWSQQDAGWCSADLPRRGQTWSTTASQGMRHVLLSRDRRPVFLVASRGPDDLVCLYPVCFWIANGQNGEITVGKNLASQKELPAWAAYGEPIVHDFDEDGRPEVLLDSPYILAVLELDGSPLWHGLGRDDYPVRPDEGNVGETTRCKHALADFDGDGTLEIASAGYGDGVRAIDAKTGRVLWSLQAPQPTGPKVAAVNIDGQGGDEIIYPAGNTLVAVTGDRSSGRVLWTWQGPAALSLPAIADVDGDNLAEIIVQDAAATIHCLESLRINWPEASFNRSAQRAASWGNRCIAQE